MSEPIRRHVCRTVLLASAFLLVPAPLAHGQAPAGRISGRTVATHGPVPRVEVRLFPSGDSTAARIQVTDSSGAFAFAAVPRGEWRLAARRVGYAPVEEQIAFSGERDTLITIRMTLVPRTLDTVRVAESGMPARYGPSSVMETFYARRARGRGTFFTRDQIERSGHSTLQPLFASVPGVRVRTDQLGRIYLNSSRCLGVGAGGGSGTLGPNMGGSGNVGTFALYVDGMRTSPGLIPETLKELSTAEIEALEVYRGPAELPAEAMGDACAAVFIWTRRTAGRTVRDSL